MTGPVLLLTAHADDTEFFAGGTVAKFVAEGRDVFEVIATDNGRGSFDMDQASLIVQSRDIEARDAARILGKKDVFFLGLPDGFLDDTPKNTLRERFIFYIRKLQPSIVMTFDPFAPYEPHPDHRAVAFAAMEAVSFAHMPLFHPEHLSELSPHLVAETWYFAKCPRDANRIVDISDFIEKKVEAVLAHDSQMRMTVKEISMALSITGEGNELLLDNYQKVIEHFVKQWAKGVGKRGGFEYGEEFRVERAGDLIRSLTAP